MADREWVLPAFGARVKERARRLGLASFWQWWMRELDALMPAAPRTALARRRMRPVLVFSGEFATLWRPTTANGQPIMVVATTIPLTGDAAAIVAAGRAALAPLLHSSGGPAAPMRMVISLPARDVLRRNIVLPAAVEENFRQALAYDLDRHTPFKAEELYFDAAIVDRDAVRSTITIDLAAARRAVVDPALKTAAAWGADVAAVVPEPPERAATSRLNLLPAEARTSSSARSWRFWVPIAMIAVAALAAVTIPLWQKREYVIELTMVADQARGRAAVSETLRAELDARVADYNSALERKYAFPSALQVVNAVSKLLPDDTWLTQFELKTMAKGKETQRDLLVRGETANAGHLVQLFEESQIFAQAAPRSQTTKIQPGPGEIFDLGAQLKTQALPAPLALAVADARAEPSPPGSAPPSAAAPAAGSPPKAPPPVNASAPPPGTTPLPGAPAPPGATAASGTAAVPGTAVAPGTAAGPGATAAPGTATPPGATAPPAAPARAPLPAAGSAPPSSPAPGATAGSPPAVRNPLAPEPRMRQAEPVMPPAAGPLSPGLAPPAEAGKAPGNGGAPKP